jgi:hypothetical protein
VEAGRVSVRPSRKTVFTSCARPAYLRALEGAAPHRFRPMYAGANMGHPSKGEASTGSHSSPGSSGAKARISLNLSGPTKVVP